MKKFKMLLMGMLLAFTLVGCGSTNETDGIHYDGIDTMDEDEYAKLKEEIKAELRAEMAAEIAAESEASESAEAVSGTDVVSNAEDDELTLDDISEDDIRYKIFSNDIVTSAIAKGELAKTGDPEIDAFLQRFYEKAMDGDTYIEFMLQLAESSGVDVSVIDDLIDYNASRKIGVWLEDIEDLISEKSETETKE